MIDETAYDKATAAVQMRRNLAVAYPSTEEIWAMDADRMLITIYENSRSEQSWNNTEDRE